MYTEETAMKKQQVFEKDVVFVKIEGIERRKCIVKWKDNTLRKQQVFEKDVILRKNGTTERRKYCEIDIFSQYNVRYQVVLKQKL